MNKVIIFGISGQDGGLLANFLFKVGGFEIFGTTRSLSNDFTTLKQLKIFEKIKILEIDPIKYENVYNLIFSIKPQLIFNLSGQTSVGKSFLFPLETYESTILTTINILNSIKKLDKKIRFLNAASSECFGESNVPVDELTHFNPISPYAVAKTSSILITRNYREAYGLFVCSAILSNHESCFRGKNFISSKIVSTVFDIKQQKKFMLEVGNIDVIRDWGWAEDYVEAMYLILCQDFADEYIVATGKSISLREFISYSFSKFGMNYLDYIKIDENLHRANEVKEIYLNPKKSEINLKWRAKHDVFNVIDKLFDENSL